MSEATYRNSRNSYLGEKGTQRKNAMLDALDYALRYIPWKELKVNDVALRAMGSNALFYNYFSCLESAFDALWDRYAEQGKEAPEHVLLIHELLEFEKVMKR